jgi:hypothetical protein
MVVQIMKKEKTESYYGEKKDEGIRRKGTNDNKKLS